MILTTYKIGAHPGQPLAIRQHGALAVAETAARAPRCRQNPRLLAHLGRYLELYRDPALARTLRDAGLDSTEYPASVARTWLLSFRALSAEHPPAVELLRLCAYLDPDDIDLDLLAEGRQAAGTILAKVLGNQLEITEAAGALARVSLATAASPGHLRVHRLVQAVTRDQLDSDQAAWAQRALNLVSAIFPSDPYDHRSWPACASVAPHVLASVRHIDSYLALARQAGSLLTCLGIYLTTSAQLTAARTTQERALAIKEAAYGPNHPEIAITLANLDDVMRQLGDQ